MEDGQTARRPDGEKTSSGERSVVAQEPGWGLLPPGFDREAAAMLADCPALGSAAGGRSGNRGAARRFRGGRLRLARRRRADRRLWAAQSEIELRIAMAGGRAILARASLRAVRAGRRTAPLRAQADDVGGRRERQGLVRRHWFPHGRPPSHRRRWVPLPNGLVCAAAASGGRVRSARESVSR